MGHKGFLRWVTFEWLLGIVLFVTFVDEIKQKKFYTHQEKDKSSKSTELLIPREQASIIVEFFYNIMDLTRFLLKDNISRYKERPRSFCAEEINKEASTDLNILWLTLYSALKKISYKTNFSNLPI